MNTKAEQAPNAMKVQEILSRHGAAIQIPQPTPRRGKVALALDGEGPPHSDGAEAAVLGALLQDPAAWGKIWSIVSEPDFYFAAHRTIWRAIERVHHDDQAPDAVTVAEVLREWGELDNVGGLKYLQALEREIPNGANIAAYARAVARLAQQRQLAGDFEALREAALVPGANLDELISLGERTLATSPRRMLAAPPLDLRALSERTPPERVWALRYWIAMGHAHLLVGVGGIGKSTFLGQLAACLAIARPFIDEIPAPQRVLMWACEDDADEIWRRLLAVATWLDVPLDALAENLHIVPRHGRDNALFTNEGGHLRFTLTLNELRAQVHDLGAQVVMLDNLAHMFGADENRRHDVTTFLNGLAGALPGRALILAGHPSRAEGSEFSGSSAWENAVRARFYLGRFLPDQRPGDADEDSGDAVRFLARRKANYSARDWRRFRYSDGVLVPDPVETGGGMVDEIRRKKAERVALDGLAKLKAMDVRAVDAMNSPAFLPRLLLDYRLADGCTKSDLTGAMRALMLDGRITRATVGRYSNRSPMQGLIVAEAP